MNKSVKEELEQMGMADLKEMLANDPLYKQIMASLPESERAKVEALALDFVTDLQKGTLDNIMKMAENPEFINAFANLMYNKESN